jgi:deazaflavin-dependent oxidoreductase (nitroreductase family)
MANKQLYDAFWGTVLRATTRGHRWLYRVSGGRWGRHLPGGVQVIWLTHAGVKSGRWRRTPLITVADSDAPTSARDTRVWVVAGSNVGQKQLPAWVHNLRARRDGFAEVNRHFYPAVFDEASGADRDALYARLIAAWRGFAMYQRNAGRYIPVFRVRLGSEIPPEAVPGESTAATSSEEPR